MLKLTRMLAAFSLFCLFALQLMAEPYAGYTLFGQNNSNSTRLIDLSYSTVHTWNSTRNGGYSAYLLENGHLVRTANHNNPTFNGGGGQGYVQEFDWSSNLVWEYLYSNSDHRAHHDIEPMPNGNVLLIAWEYRSAVEAIQAGLDQTTSMWPDHIVEVEPSGDNGGNIIWEWHAWDHLIQDHDATKDNYGVIGDHPELLDINMGTLAGGPGGGGDWMHINGISYNPTRDEIVISSHNLDEFYVIDHSTTTAEAAGHTGGTRGRGGDILYRWGCPANYDAPGMRYLNVAHCSAWIPAGLPGAGNILVFNNREGQGTSIVAEINPPYDQDGNYIWEAGSAYDPSAPAWTYTAAGFHSNHLGGCQRLANGNTIIVESTSGRIFEVDADGAIQWEYNHSREIARALRYASDYPGVYGLNPLEPGEIVLNELLAVNGSIQADQDGEYDSWIEFYNNTSDEVSLWGFTLTDENDNPDKWTFPDTSIAANDYLIVWADNDIEQEGLHLNWEPSATGSITFFAPDQTILDEISYSDQIADSSIGRYPNGMGEFMRMQPTFAAENDSSGPETSSAATQIPARFELLQNFPNPFNSTTTIRFRIAETVKVSLTVFNITGAQVGVLTQATLTPGEYSVNWNGSDSSGKALAAGLYFYTLHAGAFSATRKLIYLK